MAASADPAPLRLADILAALSVVTDLDVGRPRLTAVHACFVATRLAQEMGLADADVSDVYYATLLRYIGRTAYAHEEAMLAGGDEIDARSQSTRIDLANPRDSLSYYILHVGRHAQPWRRAALASMSLPRTLLTLKDMVVSHCEVGSGLARRLVMSSGVQTALLQIFERWDGKGWPDKRKGEELGLPIRYAHVATHFVAYTLKVCRRLGEFRPVWPDATVWRNSITGSSVILFEHSTTGQVQARQ